MLPLDLLAAQDGVVNRRQLLAAGLDANDVRRLVRRRDLTPLHHGTYLDHTGTPTWAQTAWAAVLACEPAALAGASALRAFEARSGGLVIASRGQPVHVVVPWERRVRVPGVEVQRRRDFDRLVRVGSPPCVRVEDAVIDVAAAAPSDVDAVSVLSRPLQLRITTPHRLLACVHQRRRVPRRTWLLNVLTDLAAGTCSVLEHGYLVRVERPHGLPVALRQVRDRLGRGVVYRDVEYRVGRGGGGVAAEVVIELDGRAHHAAGRGRELDLDRDLESVASGKVTGRVSYGQVFDRPCWTASQVGQLLQVHGWDGRTTPCARCD